MCYDLKFYFHFYTCLKFEKRQETYQNLVQFARSNNLL